MNKVIRGRNKNNKKVIVLFVLQVIVGMMPVLLLIAFVWLKLYTQPISAAVVIGLIMLCNVGYMFLARRYGVLNSGVRGEKQLYRTVKKLGGNNIIILNLPVRYKRGRSELDTMLITHKGVIIIEVKNHSGSISGSWKSDKWMQRKYYRDGKVTQQEMDNPIKQMRRQRDIVKSILNSAGEDVWIDTVLYFSSPNAKLRLNLRENDYVCSSSSELLHFLEKYDSGTVISKTRMDRLAQIMKDAACE